MEKLINENQELKLKMKSKKIHWENEEEKMRHTSKMFGNN